MARERLSSGIKPMLSRASRSLDSTLELYVEALNQFTNLQQGKVKAPVAAQEPVPAHSVYLPIYIQKCRYTNTCSEQVLVPEQLLGLLPYYLKIQKHIFTPEVNKLLVSATIVLLIDYCCLILIGSTAENDLKLQRAINSAIRFIFKLKCDKHITPHRRELKWLSINSRRTYFLATYFYKLLSSGKPNYSRDLFNVDESRRSERLAIKDNNVNLLIPNYNTSFLESSFIISAIRLWQKLPPEILNATSLKVFKKKL
ncbi:Protein of unknown function [Cotesia congregata]|uniref:Uncharacterized protein n=1 Tax=Cotesia congregata TaxID=51543 RepID=A0A8J2HC00_COTCN|nr:Protein of unknown function [Cotesia congregata]